MKNKFMFGIMVFLILAMPVAFAKANETVEIKGGKEYPLLERALDRIKLVFALQIERRTELMSKIQERRDEHYNFLIAKGKTEQAEAFKERTIGLVKNFEEWKARKLGTVQMFENKTEAVKERTENRTAPEKTRVRY